MRIAWIPGFLIGVTVLASAAQAQLPSLPPPAMPRGLVSNSPEVTPGYALFSPTEGTPVILIANDGSVVHTWENVYGGLSHYLEADGTLLRGFRDPEILHFRQGGVTGGLQELAWDGKVLWEWKLGDEKRVLHHDISRLPNGNILALGWELKTRRRGDQSRTSARGGARKRADARVRCSRFSRFARAAPRSYGSGTSGITSYRTTTRASPTTEVPAERPERLDLNAGAEAVGHQRRGARPAAGPGLCGFRSGRPRICGWTSCTPTPSTTTRDSIRLPSRCRLWARSGSSITRPPPKKPEVQREVEPGKGGDILYRWGNPATYGRGDTSSTRLFFQHDVRWIPEGWERAGNLTIFNNGRDRPAGRFLFRRRNQATAKAGRNLWPSRRAKPTAPDRVGLDGSASARSLCSLHFRRAARLQNQNTFVCAGTDGRLLELSPAGEIVWEYRNPFGGNLVMADGKPATAGADERPYAVFRATRIPLDHPALKGRHLKPLDPQPAWTDLPEKFRGGAHEPPAGD